MRNQIAPIAAVGVLASLLASGQSARPQKPPANGGDFSSATTPVVKVPADVIVVKGAWSNASDTTTPLPEQSKFANNLFSNAYFGISYSIPSGWAKDYDGPPPSDSGRYVLAQFQPAPGNKTAARGEILVTAQDMFFSLLPADNALQIVNYMKDNLQPYYKLELPPTETKVGGRPFIFFAYWSPPAQLHWYVLATQIRCHAVEIVLTSRDTKLLGNMLLDLEKMSLPAEAGPTAGTGGGPFPVCMKNYARDENMTARVDPIFTEHRANPVPVRIIIDTKGKVKHIHFLSAFPDQEKAIADALAQWKFKPYLQNGHPVEVETGIMFGRAQASTTTSTQRPSVE